MEYNRLKNIVSKYINHGYRINTVYDIGANKGEWTAKWSKILLDSSFVMFEGNPNQPMPLWADQQKYEWNNILLSRPGIENVDFYMTENMSYGGTGDSYYKEATVAYQNIIPQKIAAFTLDQIIVEKQFSYPQLVKLDTQGSELDIIAGGIKAFSNADICISEVPILEYNTNAPTFNDYLRTFKDLGFLPVGIDQDHFYKGALIQVDIVFVKDYLVGSLT